MKYVFEVKEEIRQCAKCPVSMWRFNGLLGEICCGLTGRVVKQNFIPESCPLQKVDEVSDELKLLLDSKGLHIEGSAEAINTALTIKHCGNCEYCNLYKEQEPCNSCRKQSNWKKRIFY